MLRMRGRGQETRLTQAVFDWFQIKEPRDLVAAVYAPDQDRHTLARLAEVVTEVGAEGDPVAATVVKQAAVSLTELVYALWQQLQLQGSPISVAATGGVIVNSEYYQQQFEAELQRRKIEARVNYVRHPVAGAIQIARQSLGST